MIYTGGTIGMIEKDDSLVAFDFGLIQKEFIELRQFSCEIEVHSYDPPMDSSNMTPEVWIELARIIYRNYQHFDGFIILHGSDTMAYTGSALSFMLEGLMKPVILTGSQLPINSIRTDAKENLIGALEVATDEEFPIKEVCIYFGDRIFRANRTKKVHADVFRAFNSPNFPPLGEAGVHIRIRRPTPEDAWLAPEFRLQDKLETRIALKKFYPGITHNILDSILLEPEVKGIILESYGAGNIPTAPGLIESIRQSIQMGKVILNITQCVAGSVEMGRYETSKMLKDAGVLDGRDLTFEAALTKMMYLMGKYEDQDKLRYFLEHNIRGEMTAKRAYTN